jgi:drug/metabolite transporter (DMT)-like permease
MKKQIKADLALLFVTIGWGSSFLLTKNALNDLSTFNFLGIRFIMAGMLSFLIFFNKMIKIDRKTLKIGFFMGLLLYLHYVLQTIGITITTVSKSAFITGINVVLVPVFSALFIKRMPKKSAVLGVLFAFIGMSFLTLNTGELDINLGDFLTLMCAIVFAFYIILVGKYTVEVDSIAFAVVQILVVGIFSMITSFIFESPILPSGALVWGNIIFLAVVCTSGAYIIQNIAQQHTSPTHTALIYSGEPVFAAVFAYFFAHEILTIRGIIGAFLILLGMLVAEINLDKIFMKKEIKNYEN